MTDPQTGLEIPDEAAQRQQAAEALAQLDAPAPAAVSVMAPSTVAPPPVDPASGATVTPAIIPPPAQEPVTITQPGDEGAPPVAPAAASVMAPNAPAPKPAASGDELIAPAGSEPPTPQSLAIGELPQPPQLTGDHETDLRANMEYQRKLLGYHESLARAHAEVARQGAAVEANKAQRVAEAEQEAQRKVAELAQRRAQEREVQQKAIANEVDKRSRREADLSRGWWASKTTGGRIQAAIAVALGAIGAGIQNAGAAQLGQVGHAENLALNTINKLMDEDYSTKLKRLEMSDKSVHEARYGFKESEENYRAMRNDLDADRAAKYRSIAATAEAEMRARGASDADIAASQEILEFRSKAAQSEGAILEREEKQRDERAKYRAELTLAQAHLGLQREQINATREARADARNDKQAAADQRRKDALDARTLSDPDTGESIEVLPTARGVQTQSDKLTSSRAYSRSLRSLADDIEKNKHVGSDLPIIGTDAGRNRTSLYSDVLERGRKAMDLGVSNANLQLEHGGIGGSGAGISMKMADPKRLRELADEQDRIAMERIRSSGKPVTGKTVEQAAAAAKPKASARDEATIDEAWKVYTDPKQSEVERRGALNYLRMNHEVPAGS